MWPEKPLPYTVIGSAGKPVTAPCNTLSVHMHSSWTSFALKNDKSCNKFIHTLRQTDRQTDRQTYIIAWMNI